MLTKSIVTSIMEETHSSLLSSLAQITLSSIPPNLKSSLLIDGPNFQRTRKSLKIERDYLAIFGALREIFNLHSIYYFIGLYEDVSTTPLVRELHWLSKMGVRVITRSATKHTSPSGEVFFKGNMDTHICVTALTECQNVDNVILASGDKDFVVLLNALKARGQRTTVLSSEHSDVDCLAHELRLCADTFIDLAWVKNLIQKKEEEINPRDYLN